MRFFSEFALLARDLHDAVDLYGAECQAGDFGALDPARLLQQLDQAEARIEALTSQAAVPGDRIGDYISRLQRLGIQVDLPTPSAAIEADAGPATAADLDLDGFLDNDDDCGEGRSRPMTPSRPAHPRSSSSSCRIDMETLLKSPEMPTISSHSQAIMSLRYQTDLTGPSSIDKVDASPARVLESEFEQVPGFVTSRVTLEEVNDVLSRVSIGDRITSDHLEKELESGLKAKAAIMVLQQLDRVRSSRGPGGDVFYEITAGPFSSSS